MPTIRMAGLPDGRIAVADSVGYRVKIVSRDGELEKVIGRSIPPLPVTETTKEAERLREKARITDRDVVRGLRDMAAISGLAFPITNVNVDNVVSEYHQTLDDLPFAGVIPVIRSIRVDWEGRLWITRSDATAADGPIDIVEADGRYIGSLAPGGRGSPTAFGPNGLMAYAQEEDGGTASVLVVRITSLAPLADRQ